MIIGATSCSYIHRCNTNPLFCTQVLWVVCFFTLTHGLPMQPERFQRIEQLAKTSSDAGIGERESADAIPPVGRTYTGERYGQSELLLKADRFETHITGHWAKPLSTTPKPPNEIDLNDPKTDVRTIVNFLQENPEKAASLLRQRPYIEEAARKFESGGDAQQQELLSQAFRFIGSYGYSLAIYASPEYRSRAIDWLNFIYLASYLGEERPAKSLDYLRLLCMQYIKSTWENEYLRDRVRQLAFLMLEAGHIKSTKINISPDPQVASGEGLIPTRVGKIDTKFQGRKPLLIVEIPSVHPEQHNVMGVPAKTPFIGKLPSAQGLIDLISNSFQGTKDNLFDLPDTSLVKNQVIQRAREHLQQLENLKEPLRTNSNPSREEHFDRIPSPKNPGPHSKIFNSDEVSIIEGNHPTRPPNLQDKFPKEGPGFQSTLEILQQLKKSKEILRAHLNPSPEAPSYRDPVHQKEIINSPRLTPRQSHGQSNADHL